MNISDDTLFICSTLLKDYIEKREKEKSKLESLMRLPNFPEMKGNYKTKLESTILDLELCEIALREIEVGLRENNTK